MLCVKQYTHRFISDRIDKRTEEEEEEEENSHQCPTRFISFDLVAEKMNQKETVET